MQNGELFVTGRIKDVIIIRGRNHYPQDIELTVEKSHPSLKLGSGAAFSIDINGEERLVVCQEIERSYLRKLDINEVVTAIRRAVSQEHELQLYAVVLLKTGSILKTSSGKIQRQACLSSFINDDLNVVGLWKSEVEILKNVANSLESSQYDLTSESLHSNSEYTIESILNWIEAWVAKKLKIDPHQIDPSKSFADYGIDSIMAVEFSQALGDWLEHPLEATILWNFSTIESLGQYLTDELKKKSSASQPLVLDEQEISPAPNYPPQLEIESLIDQEILELEKLLGAGK